jgi:WD40 repeat protein
MQAYDPNAN